MPVFRFGKIATFLGAADRAGCLRAALRSVAGGAGRASPEASLSATLAWLREAQDASADGGVSYGYSLTTGWQPSYPETTGYIIPTMLTAAKVFGSHDDRLRALRMADWEIEIQLPTGAVLAGPLGTPVAPAVFNTGQVLFGWNAAFRATGDARYREAAMRAGAWLVAGMDADGAWRRELSNLTEVSPIAINVRTGWALAETGVLHGVAAFIEAGRRNCEWTLSMQDGSGWFRSNAFFVDQDPLLHNIVYVIEGLIGAGTLLHEQPWLDAAERAAAGLAGHYRARGRLFGRYATGWEPRARWRCLTGDSQLAGAFLRLASQGRTSQPYAALAGRILESVTATQVVGNRRRPGMTGGVAGSWPIWGEYITFCYPNWAAKFHADALLMLLHNADPHDPLAAHARGG